MKAAGLLFGGFAVVVQAVAQTLAVGNIAPATIGMMALKTTVLGQTAAWVMAQTISMTPFMTGFVATAVDQCADAVTATQAMWLAAILIITPGVMVGDLFKQMRVTLVHVVAGDAVVGEVNPGADLCFGNVATHITTVVTAVSDADIVIDNTAADNHFVELHVGIRTDHKT